MRDKVTFSTILSDIRFQVINTTGKRCFKNIELIK